jgi:hypothetical protein
MDLQAVYAAADGHIRRDHQADKQKATQALAISL